MLSLVCPFDCDSLHCVYTKALRRKKEIVFSVESGESSVTTTRTVAVAPKPGGLCFQAHSALLHSKRMVGGGAVAMSFSIGRVTKNMRKQ